VADPTDAPVVPPVSIPVADPTDAPVVPPVSIPVAAPTDAPVVPPVSTPAPTNTQSSRPSSTTVSTVSDTYAQTINLNLDSLPSEMVNTMTQVQKESFCNQQKLTANQLSGSETAQIDCGVTYDIIKQTSRRFLQAGNNRKLDNSYIQVIEFKMTFTSSKVDISDLNENFQTAANEQTSLTSICSDLVASGIQCSNAEPIITLSSSQPSFISTLAPSKVTNSPVSIPVADPTDAPVVPPVSIPVADPTDAPVVPPVSIPVAAPTDAPVAQPVSTPAPTSSPVSTTCYSSSNCNQKTQYCNWSNGWPWKCEAKLEVGEDCSLDQACLSGNCGRNYPRKCEIETCEDKNSWCSNWANWGECTRNPGYMLNYCKVSCSVCTETCADKNTSCSSWAAQNFCTRNPGYMLKYCKLSCNACTG